MQNEVTLSQAAACLGLPWHSTHKLAMRGKLGKPRQVAGRWLVPERGVEDYIEAKRQIAAKEKSRPITRRASTS
jgi:hypothetical protein